MAAAVRVRMYRTGFGDCLLLTFGRGVAARHVLVDFGAHNRGEIGTMEPIMDSLEETTGSRLELVVASHAHRDHISGFGKFASRFAAFRLREVWRPWTDDPDDPAAAALNRRHLALYDALDRHLRVGLGAGEDDPRHAAALDALSNLRGNEAATSELARGFGVGARVRYLSAGESLADAAGISGLSVEVLAPSRDPQFLSRMDPPASQHFLTAPGDASGALRPFPRLEIHTGDTDYAAIAEEQQPVVAPGDLAALHDLAEAPADRLALALDNVRNNSSLVLLLRFRGRSLLFPGDAQWGNWQSWIGTDRARDLLREVDFLKVAHHGSENATPVDVVRGLRHSGLAAVVPTQGHPFPTIPRMPLLQEIEQRCAGHVAVRSDWIDVAGAPAGPAPRPALPAGFTAGPLWIDYEL